MIRNLLYNCFAPKWSSEWKPNIERLCQYAEAFNGRKIVLIKTGETEDAAKVEALFAPLGVVEFIHVPNDPDLGEVTGFIQALELLASTDPNEATFYAHTKGVKYKQPLERYMVAICSWRNRMYDECLSDPAKIEALLQQHACVGCFLRSGRAIQVEGAAWHYAGTYWWVNHARLFSLPQWPEVAQTFWGVEGYLGRHLPEESAHCLYGADLKHNLYSTVGIFRCSCGHESRHRMKMTHLPVKVCRKCFKRTAEFLKHPPEVNFA